MTLRDENERKALAAHIENCRPLLSHNKDLICILEGDLLRFVEAHLESELSGKAFARAKPRIPPINILKKIVDKLSRVYQTKPTRKVVNGTDADQELVEYYSNIFSIDEKMNISNEYFNTFKNCLLQPFFDMEEMMPKLRAVSNDRFIVWSTNVVDPKIPTHVALPAGQSLKKNTDRRRKDKTVMTYWVWTKDEFIVMDEEGDIDLTAMVALDNPEGVNDFGALPFSYGNRSNNFLIPPMDTDTKRMTVLIPALLGDLNYAVKFQAFSMLIGINVDDENIAIDPSAFLSFKTDPTSNQPSSVDTVKPEVDIDQVLGLIGTELSMWLNSRGIRPGAMGTAGPDATSSGISKIIDEADITEERDRQITYYKKIEHNFWEVLLKKMHPVWVAQGLVENRALFTQTATVEVDFPDQLPLMNRNQVLQAVEKELQLGLIHEETAIKRLNPEWSDDRVEEEMAKVDGIDSRDEQPATDTGDDVEEIPMAATGDLELTQETVLNGAQVSSLLEVTQTVAAGNLDKGSAIAILESAFNLSTPRAHEIIDPIVIKSPEEVKL